MLLPGRIIDDLFPVVHRLGEIMKYLLCLLSLSFLVIGCSQTTTDMSKNGSVSVAQPNFDPTEWEHICDVNKDGTVDDMDLELVRTSLNQKNSQYDVNNDGIVNVLDIVRVRNSIGWIRPVIQIGSFDQLLGFAALSRDRKSFAWRMAFVDNVVFSRRIGPPGVRLYGSDFHIQGNGYTIDMAEQNFVDGMTISENATNGIEFFAQNVTMENVKIVGFDGGGSAVKCYIDNRLEMKNVTFENIGAVVHPFLAPEPIPSAYYTWGGQPVGGRARISIFIDCTWENCALDNLYTHCVYLTGEQLYVFASRTIKSGHPMKFLPSGERSNQLVVLINNSFDLLPVPFRTSEMRLPFLLLPYQPLVAISNEFTWDESTDKWHGSPLWNRAPDRMVDSVLRHNIYRGLVDRNMTWMVPSDTGKPVSLEIWIKEFEGSSIWNFKD